MIDVQVIADPAAAVSALDPVPSRLLAELTEPASAATLALRIGIARQKVNYHLEQHWSSTISSLLRASASGEASPSVFSSPPRPRTSSRLRRSARWPPTLVVPMTAGRRVI